MVNDGLLIHTPKIILRSSLLVQALHPCLPRDDFPIPDRFDLEDPKGRIH